MASASSTFRSGRSSSEAVRGYEHLPIRTSFVVTHDTDELVFEHEKSLHWRERGWVSADTHVHFLSPQTARLEGEAEGVNVTNILASQWGEMFSNVGDFDGRTTIGASTVDGTGEYLVRVGTENRMQVLGHIALLGYSGSMIHPLCTGGPDESAAGDPLEVSMAHWAKQCIDQGGLVVMPHAPFPQLERAADLILGLVHAVEMGDAMNQLHLDPDHPLNLHVSPYGLADCYRYLNLGLQVPLVGGSDKMSASHLLGGIRCYAQLGARALTYENWMAAVKEGNTFVTIGPLATLQVEGVSPGGQIDLPSGGGTLHVEWQVESGATPCRPRRGRRRRPHGRRHRNRRRSRIGGRCCGTGLGTNLDRAASAGQLPRTGRGGCPHERSAGQGRRAATVLPGRRSVGTGADPRRHRLR